MKYKYMSSIVVCSSVLFISLGSIITPDQEVSELEGRTLETIPLQIESEDVKGVLDGAYFSKWDTYFSDHILGRNYFVSTYNQVQKLLNKRRINDVYLGEDDYLFSLSEYKVKTQEELQTRAQFFNDLASTYQDSQLYVVNLPNKYIVNEDKIPIEGYHSQIKGEFARLANEFDEEVMVLDLEKTLLNTNEYFYKTDHHWNMNGVYEGYSQMIRQLQSKFPQIPSVIDKSEFNIEIYPHCFVGSDGRKVGQLVNFQEDIEVWNHPDYENISVKINDKDSSFYHYNRLSEDFFNNDYTVYMGGDNALEVITNPNVDNDLSLVLIGDSMSNPLIPLLSLHFKTIYSYDMRHYKGDILADLNDINPDIITLIGLTPNMMQSYSEVFKLK